MERLIRSLNILSPVDNSSLAAMLSKCLSHAGVVLVLPSSLVDESETGLVISTILFTL